MPDAAIFRAYDIRGIAFENLDTATVGAIGTAFAARAAEEGQSRVAVGGDGRESTPALLRALVGGLVGGGMEVIDVGVVPTPLLYYATHVLGTGTGIMVTGSHNPPEYNGLKMVLAGSTLAGAAIENLRLRVEQVDATAAPAAASSAVDLKPRYVDEVLADVRPARPLKVVVDCGNGVAGLVAPRLLAALGCEVESLYEEVDATFPNHHPDPAEPDNLADLIAAVAEHRADIGLAFDGDGDRLGVVTDAGAIVWPDTLLMAFARDIARRHPGAGVVYDVKCSRHVETVAEAAGARPIMSRTGHSHIKARIRETGALLGGEFSGHLCFADRWYGFDDALYAAARTVELLAAQSATAAELFGALPHGVATPEIKLPTTEEAKFGIVEALSGRSFGGGRVTDIDGIRVDRADGFGLVRASNTSPVLSLRFEADDEAALARIQRAFQAELSAIDPALRFLPAGADQGDSP